MGRTDEIKLAAKTIACEEAPDVTREVDDGLFCGEGP